MAKYRIELTKEEVDELMAIIKKGSHSTLKFRVAHILLNCDEGEHGEKVPEGLIGKVLKVSGRTIERTKKRFVEEGLGAVLERRPTTRRYDIKLDGDVEAKLVKLCCSEPPEGRAKWSLRLLADKMVELEYVEEISHVSVGKMSKKTNLSLGGSGDG